MGEERKQIKIYCIGEIQFKKVLGGAIPHCQGLPRVYCKGTGLVLNTAKQANSMETARQIFPPVLLAVFGVQMG